MSSRSPIPTSRHWAKPLGLSAFAHLTVLVAIPALLGISLFALRGGGESQRLVVHELSFDTARIVNGEGDVKVPLERILAPPEEDWPRPEETMEWQDAMFELSEPAPEVVEPKLPEPQFVPREPKPQIEPQPSVPELEPEVVPEISEQSAAPTPEIPSAPEAAKEPTWLPLTLTEHCPEPRYPAKARRRKQEGAVVLLLTVDPGGHVLEVEIVESSGHSALDRAAKKTLATWRFGPAPVAWAGGNTKVRRRILFQLPK